MKDDNENIMRVMIGNIPPLCDIEIEFSYLEELPVVMNSFRKFTLLASLIPRSATIGV